MSSKYDKSIAISHEEEGTYHRRQVDYPGPARPRSPVTTHYVERYTAPAPIKKSSQAAKSSSSSSNLIKSKAAGYSSQSDDDDNDNFEEWTTSKRKVNHKTRQVETRVSRQLLVRGGEVIADSGPQVVTRIKEDNKVEESEKEKTPKNKGRFEALESATECADGSNANGLVLGEKKEIQRVSREVREENMQYHDERFRELTGKDVHRRAIKAPHELMTINDEMKDGGGASSKPRGKMIHYSNKGKKYQDTDEILEVAKLAIDGSITKEVKRTKHHEEFSEDEKPDEKGEAEQLRHKPIAERSSRRFADYVNDFDDTDSPAQGGGGGGGDFVPVDVQRYDSDASAGPIRRGKTHYGTQSAPRRAAGQSSASTLGGASGRRSKHDDEAFPRYEIDPLLNSLRDEDFKPIKSNASNIGDTYTHNSRGRRRDSCTSSDDDDDDAAAAEHYRSRSTGRRQQQQQQHRHSPAASPSGANRVDIPEEYRVNKQRLITGKSSSGQAGSTLSHKSTRSQQQQQHRSLGAGRKEDAATQARLTDEEVERHSMRSGSPVMDEHAKTTRYLQRQSTPNSSRHYYYGDQHRRHQVAAANSGKNSNSNSNRNTTTGGSKQRPLIRSSSSSSSGSLSSLNDPKEKLRRQGASSRDSGFKSPHQQSHRGTETPDSLDKRGGQIYSVSGKQHKSALNNSKYNRDQQVVSPAPSLGQRSVKTTTTTMSAGLADRPLSRNERSVSTDGYNKENRTRSKSRNSDNKLNDDYEDYNRDCFVETRQQRQRERRQQRRRQQVPVGVYNDDHDNNSNCNSNEEEGNHQVDELTVVQATNSTSARNQCHDTVSISSLQSANATKIKVPYKRIIEIEREQASDQQQQPFNTTKTTTTKTANNRNNNQASALDKSSSEMSFQEDIESLSKRLAIISRERQLNHDGIASESDQSNPKRRQQQQQQHFDYKTIVANVQPASAKQQQQVIDAYNVRVIEQNSPFNSKQVELSAHNNNNNNNNNNNKDDNDNKKSYLTTPGATTVINIDHTDNNNETNFSLDNYVKYRATPALVYNHSLQSNDNNEDVDVDDDQMSQNSSVSLHSARTYNIRKLDATSDPTRHHNHYQQQQLDLSTNKQQQQQHFETTTIQNDLNSRNERTTNNAEHGETNLHDEQQQEPAQNIAKCETETETETEREAQLTFDENGNGKPAAWIFDPRDGSSTAIVPPARPKQPDVPAIDARTEELNQARGGRSYYLELLEPSGKAAKRPPRPSSIDSLYSRWNSQGALNIASSPLSSSYRPLAPATTRQNNLPRLIGSTSQRLIGQNELTGKTTTTTTTTNAANQQQPKRRQLPFGGPPSSLGDRSKSSSCLLSVTKPSKYSIYGGFKKPGESNKPVPRLSYSRAIGPRSQRALDNQPKTPSRYIKMR